MAVRESGHLLRAEDQLVSPDQSVKVDSQSIRLTDHANKKATRSGIQKYSWQHQQAQNALYRHMQTQNHGTLGIQRNSEVENPRMGASIDEGEPHEFGAPGEASRQDSFAFESSADASEKGMQFKAPKGTIGGDSMYGGARISLAAGSEHSKRMSQYSKNLQGFGAYSQNQMQLGMSERDRKKEQ